MVTKKIITTLSFMTIFCCATSLFAETATFKTSFDCSKATIAVEKTICEVKALADADTELGRLYNNLLYQLPETEKAILKKEQMEWLATRNKSCVNKKDNIACVQDLYFKRVEALNKLTVSTATGTTTQVRTITFKPTDKTFTEFSKGIVDINVNRQIAFDTSVDLSTGILKSKWKNEQPITTKIPDVRGPDSLINAEVLIAKPVFDKEWKKVEGYYFVIYLSRWSTAKNGRGNCGSGVEIVSTILCKLHIRVNWAAPYLPDLFSNSIPFSTI